MSGTWQTLLYGLGDKIAVDYHTEPFTYALQRNVSEPTLERLLVCSDGMQVFPTTPVRQISAALGFLNMSSPVIPNKPVYSHDKITFKNGAVITVTQTPESAQHNNTIALLSVAKLLSHFTSRFQTWNHDVNARITQINSMIQEMNLLIMQ